MKRLSYGFFAVLLTILPLAGLFAQQKYALVIGNSNYTGISKLTNPVNDANDMAAALQSLGFTVDKVLDGDLEQMEKAVDNLKRKLGSTRNSYGFFFYAGHGVQTDGGQNYLIPVQANNILNETHLRTRAVPLQFVLDSLKEADNELNMIVLDACRDNPFGWNRSGARGLSMVSNVPSGSIVMFAAASGQKADDGSGRNGLFTGYLLNNLKTTSLSVYEVFDKTMGDVRNITGGRQDPELSLRFSGANSVYLGSRSSQPTVTSGSVTVESEIAGEIYIDGQATGRRIKAGGTETISNVSTGSTEVWVKDSDGVTIKAPAVMVRQGQTVTAVIERPIPEGLAFEIVDGKSVTITKYSGDAATVHIPEKIYGLPVTSIGNSAFFSCSNLTSISIPSSVTSISNRAFAYCDKLTSITVDSRNTLYSSVNGVLFDKNVQTLHTYPAGKTASAYTIPSSVTVIGNSAFFSCSNLTSISIPSSVTSIQNAAFFSCSNLTSISIPSSVTSIGNRAFAYCDKLTSITVDSRNTLYSSVNGVLFDKNVQTLHTYPAGKTASAYTIPSSVTVIGNSAFASCSNLTSISIPSSVTSIQNAAFFYCLNLTNISIPSSVTSIGNSAFAYCSNLTSISIPSSVTSIGISAFNNCVKLTSLTLSRRTQVGENVFPSSARITYSD